METVLKLFKIDLGITHELRDELFKTHIEACRKELIERGIYLDLSKTEDVKLLSDYSAWTYRTRTEDIPLSKNLQWRINNRKISARAKGNKNVPTS